MCASACASIICRGGPVLSASKKSPLGSSWTGGHPPGAKQFAFCQHLFTVTVSCCVKIGKKIILWHPKFAGKTCICAFLSTGFLQDPKAQDSEIEAEIEEMIRPCLLGSRSTSQKKFWGSKKGTRKNTPTKSTLVQSCCFTFFQRKERLATTSYHLYAVPTHPHKFIVSFVSPA